MSTPTPTAPTPKLLIDVPPGFAGLPITGKGEDIAAHIRELSTKAADSSPQPIDDLEDNLGAIAHFMARENIRLFGRFAVSADDLPEPVLANLALAMPRLDVGRDQVETIRENRHNVAKELVKLYRERFPDADVHEVTLDMGPAMVAQRAGEFHIPPAATGRPDEVVRTEFKAEFQIPTPDGLRLVIMTVTTDSEAGWPAVAAEAVRIANGIRLEYPESGAVSAPAE